MSDSTLESVAQNLGEYFTESTVLVSVDFTGVSRVNFYAWLVRFLETIG